MRRIKLVVSYDGTAYCGWQLQPNGVTIEEVLNQALSSLLKEDIQVIGASRTDSGDVRGIIRSVMEENKSPKLPGLPSFTGGLVGYFPMTISNTANRSCGWMRRMRKASRM